MGGPKKTNQKENDFVGDARRPGSLREAGRYAVHTGFPRASEEEGVETRVRPRATRARAAGFSSIFGASVRCP